MTEKLDNPWVNMKTDSVRRIDPELNHNLFWMIDQAGNYCFYLKTSEEFANIEIDITLRGISVIKRNNAYSGELFLILNRKNDWEIFFALCKDIISVCAVYPDNEKMVDAVEKRLKRWQTFLMQNADVSLPLTKQMGLFTELMFLRDVLIPSRGASASIISWGGPAADRQDFSFSDLAAEIKSYKTSKGPVVTIASTHQLNLETKPLYLVAYGLTETNNGKTIADLINELNIYFLDESVNVIQSFDQKLIEFGYMPGMIYDTLYKFSVDRVQGYLVALDFPKILPEQTAPEIISVSYTIDLHQCVKFEININDRIN